MTSIGWSRLERAGRILLVALPSFAAGMALMAYFSARASIVFFETARADYDLEQKIAAKCADRAGAVHQAAHHYANLVAANAISSWWDTTPARTEWTLGLPFRAMKLERVIDEMHQGFDKDRLQRVTEGRYRVSRARPAQGRPGRRVERRIPTRSFPFGSQRRGEALDDLGSLRLAARVVWDATPALAAHGPTHSGPAAAPAHS
jgi:hypothetical protein